MNKKKAKPVPAVDDKAWRRFMTHVKIQDGIGGCWAWTGHCDDKGYGQFWFAGRAHWAHRVSFARSHGGISAELTINHRDICLNPGCVCPDHLEEMTREDNSREAAERNNAPAYEEPPF